MKLHTGDNVVIITGKDKGKSGRILRVLVDRNRVVIAGINMRTRHIKKTPQGPGRIVRYEASMDVSNVMIFDPKDKKPTRIGFRTVEGNRERFAKRSGETLVSGKKLKALVEEDAKKGAKTGKEAKVDKGTKIEKGAKDKDEKSDKKSQITNS